MEEKNGKSDECYEEYIVLELFYRIEEEKGEDDSKDNEENGEVSEDEDGKGGTDTSEGTGMNYMECVV